VYNDIQCGNGPPNDAGDETVCPGRTDHGKEGCKYIGPTWKFNIVNETMQPVSSPTAGISPTSTPISPTGTSPTSAPTPPINNFWEALIRFLQMIAEWMRQ
jgi:hypothetical protein